MTAAAAPTGLYVVDIERTAHFYGVTLGFDVMYPCRDGGELVVLFRGGDRVQFRAGVPNGGVGAVCVSVANAHALARDFATHGVSLFGRRTRQDGEVGKFVICDPDGHRITFEAGDGPVVHATGVSEASPSVPARSSPSPGRLGAGARTILALAGTW